MEALRLLALAGESLKEYAALVVQVVGEVHHVFYHLDRLGQPLLSRCREFVQSFAAEETEAVGRLSTIFSGT
jgi:hypothetical protein